MLAIPDEIMSKQRDFIRFEQEANEVTKQTAEFVKKCPQIKLVVCGHLHFDYESPEDAEIKQLVTGMNTLREITVE